MCENRFNSYSKKENRAYKNYPSYQFFSKGKKKVLNLGGSHQFENN
jgi:hypothetical protein